ncbi:hypothetical protein P1S61_21565 [Streptomyces sp. ME08-AFT2]|uniref:hypothetical protein n=1 Tax=unclassified Streptomyces TaxID=2593676 RepID=UPI0029ADD57A|nr:hypothetical protein [Streptomyces sp. ME08-AFT2]MDX3311603.1 hypothetical protein [Streptomyces sp. ME08-AFT2]
MKVFGREPVYILAVIAIALKLAAAYGLDVSENQQTLINTVLSCIVAVASAIVLKTGAAGAAILQLASAGLALFVGFGLDLSAEQQAGWMSFVAAVLAVVEHREVEAPVPVLPVEQSSPVTPGSHAATV